MIGIVTVLRTGVCTNCNGPIKLGKSDLERDPSWWHQSNGKVTCPGSAVATPRHRPNAPDSWPRWCEACGRDWPCPTDRGNQR